MHWRVELREIERDEKTTQSDVRSRERAKEREEHIHMWMCMDVLSKIRTQIKLLRLNGRQLGCGNKFVHQLFNEFKLVSV